MATVTSRPSRPRDPLRAPAPSTSSGAEAPVKPSAAATVGFVEPERRRAMICEAAYFLSERRGFCPGREIDDWLAAESEIDRVLASGESANRRGG